MLVSAAEEPHPLLAAARCCFRSAHHLHFVMPLLPGASQKRRERTLLAAVTPSPSRDSVLRAPPIFAPPHPPHLATPSLRLRPPLKAAPSRAFSRRKRAAASVR